MRPPVRATPRTVPSKRGRSQCTRLAKLFSSLPQKRGEMYLHRLLNAASRLRSMAIPRARTSITRWPLALLKRSASSRLTAMRTRRRNSHTLTRHWPTRGSPVSPPPES